jgi:hypothetical protein
MFANALLDVSHSHPVDPGGAAASIRGHTSPGVTEHAWVGEPAPHVPPGIIGICLAPLIEFALNAEYPGLRLPDDPCPQIIPPSCKSIVFLPPFALYAAFPRSDYY